MKIEIKTCGKRQTLEQFADENGLVMEVGERPMDSWTRSRCIPRWYAWFRDTAIKDGYRLISTSGDGHSPQEAITNYANKLRSCVLVVDAWTPSRLEIQCPNEWE